MHRSYVGLTVICLPLILATSANAFDGYEIVEPSNKNGRTSVQLSGEIVEGDYKNVIALSVICLANNSPVMFKLNTLGGNATEAMKIGRFLRAVFAIVDIDGSSSTDEQGIQCYSSGVLILLGAPSRIFGRDNLVLDARGLGVKAKPGDYSYFNLKVTPIVGLHRPYFPPEAFSTLNGTQAQSTYAAMASTVRNYMLEMGASQELVERMFRAASDEIDLITGEDLAKHLSYMEPFYEEWQKSNCDLLTEDEGRSFLPADMRSGRLSDGYIKYLREKEAAARACARALVIKHQREVIPRYLKELGMQTLPEIEKISRELLESETKE